MNTLRLKVTSKGTFRSTSVVDMDSGAVLPCRSIRWEADADQHGLNFVTLVVQIAAIEIEQDGEMILEPLRVPAPSVVTCER